MFSPDGQWVAYESFEPGLKRSAVYVQPFPPTGAKYQISTSADNARYPLWAADGRSLFFAPETSVRFAVVNIAREPAFACSDAHLIEARFVQAMNTDQRPFDLAPDGRGFLGLLEWNQTEVDALAAPQIQVVLNWTEELKQRVPTK